MKKLLSKKEKARRQSIRRSPQIKQAIRRLDPARILTLDLETTGLTADAENHPAVHHERLRRRPHEPLFQAPLHGTLG